MDIFNENILLYEIVSEFFFFGSYLFSSVPDNNLETNRRCTINFKCHNI